MKGLLTVENLCGGAVQEKINRAIKKVVDNVLDPNTDAKKKREITLKLVFTPNEDDREDVAVEAHVAVKTASESGVTTQLFVTKDPGNGKIEVSEYVKGQIKGQMTLDEMGLLVQEGEEPRKGVVDFRKTVNE